MNANTQRVLVAVLVLLFLGSAGQYWLTQQSLERSRLEVAQLRSTVEQLNSEMKQLQAQVEQLDKTSVQGVVREANSALLDGWSSLMSTVESELVKARESMQARSSGPSTQVTKPPVNGAQGNNLQDSAVQP